MKAYSPKDFLRVVSKDSKDTTYKFALLRSVIDIVTNNLEHVETRGDERLVPIGLITYRWIQYYWPIFSEDLGQRNGEKSPLAGTKVKISFKSSLRAVMDEYSDAKTGFLEFSADFESGELKGAKAKKVTACTSSIRKAIINGPVPLFGKSDRQGENSYFKIAKETGRSRKPASSSLRGLIESQGSISIAPEFFRFLEEFGTLILGSSTILSLWADFTIKCNPDPRPTKADILDLLIGEKEAERCQEEARKFLRSSETGVLGVCVWKKAPITGTAHMDHLMPFSRYSNNHLWNLVPSAPDENISKSDKLPSGPRLQGSRKHIIRVWETYRRICPLRFENEVWLTLSKDAVPKSPSYLDNCFDALVIKCAAAIKNRGFEEW